MQRLKRSADQVLIAVPSKGRLKEHVFAFLRAKGYPIKPPDGRQLQSQLERRPDHKVVFLHPKDIAYMLEAGVVDVGFTGLDMIAETKVGIRPVIKLGAGSVKMSILVPSDSSWYHPFHLLDKTVATPFPHIARDYFARLKIRVKIRPVLGASEGMPYLGVVDGVVDVVETGGSARENELKSIADDLFDSECVCAVHKPEFHANYPMVNDLLRGLYD